MNNPTRGLSVNDALYNACESLSLRSDRNQNRVVSWFFLFMSSEGYSGITSVGGLIAALGAPLENVPV